VAQEVLLAREAGVPVEGICLYPIIDRPDWHDLAHWHHSGLWDLIPDASGCLHRVLVEEYQAALAEVQHHLRGGVGSTESG
jgi:hypothetical protein